MMIAERDGADPASLEQAAAWVVRLSGEDVGEAEWLAFVTWLDKAPPEQPDLHRQAFDRAQAVWLGLEQLGESSPAPRHGRGPSRPARRAKTLGLAALVAAAAACIATLGLWMVSHHSAVERPPPSALLAYATPPGQGRTIQLTDGSRIDMDGATALTVDLQATARHVNLAHGEAKFDVAHNPARPFEVDLGRAQVRVLGTAFDIVREGLAMQVSVSRGAVSFRDGEQTVVLPAGRAARLGDRGVIQLAQVNPADVGAWRDGRRVYWERPVSEVLADLNRQYPLPIRLAGPQARRMQFTGVLVLGTRDQMVARLTTLLPLVAKPSQDGEIVLSARRP